MVFAIHWHESAMGVHVSPILNPSFRLPSHPIPQGHPSAPALSTLPHALNLDWRSISHLIIYMFQGYSLRSSHPRLLQHCAWVLMFPRIFLILLPLQNFFFNWGIIAVQCCVGFCHTAWISHKCTYSPSLLSLLPTPHPISQCHHRVSGWTPCVI